MSEGVESADPYNPATVSVTVTPAARGRQLVRISLPLPRGFLRNGQGLMAFGGGKEARAAVRILTWYPADAGESPSARRALVTFRYAFRSRRPVAFTLQSVPADGRPGRFPVRVSVAGETVTIAYRTGLVLTARLIAPDRASAKRAAPETVEANGCYRWRRFSLPATDWPRRIEVRADALGGVVVIAHLQRMLSGDGGAPDFGWDITCRTPSARLRAGSAVAFGYAPRGAPSGADPPTATTIAAGAEPLRHSFREGTPCELLLADDRYRLYHPTADRKRRGRSEAHRGEGDALTYRYLACAAEEEAPMQQAAWRRAEFVIVPARLAPLSATLESPHEARIDWRSWDALYDTGEPVETILVDPTRAIPPATQRELAALLRYHHDAIVRSQAVGDDWGNVTFYADLATTGCVFGMNRLNHALPIFEEGYRSGDRRLVETAVLWCDNFHDQSIWWGAEQTGGTRYHSVAPRDSAWSWAGTDSSNRYMWRSNNAVTFCTKGYDAFFVAYEQTGDPRMQEALRAQIDYAARYLHAGANNCRNVGDVRDFLRLYRYTGERRYLDEASRLFRTLRPLLSTGDLFAESGKPIELNPPFIDDDQVGAQHPHAKPYILGYALAGLPDLARHTPDEPKLQAVVRAVADFMAESQDPVGGWRYPHPLSSYLIANQGVEHAWQLMQANRFLGAQESHLDAIERVLRQRLLTWRKTGKIFAGLGGWELATGLIEQQHENHALYRYPADRDRTRDYREGRIDYGFCPPEGLVYFADVLAFYLRHRPIARLTAPAAPETPLGQILAR